MKNDNTIEKDQCRYCPQVASCMGQFVVTLAFHFFPPPVLRAQGCVEHILLGGAGCTAGQRFMLRGERI